MKEFMKVFLLNIALIPVCFATDPVEQPAAYCHQVQRPAETGIARSPRYSRSQDRMGDMLRVTVPEHMRAFESLGQGTFQFAESLLSMSDYRLDFAPITAAAGAPPPPWPPLNLRIFRESFFEPRLERDPRNFILPAFLNYLFEGRRSGFRFDLRISLNTAFYQDLRRTLLSTFIWPELTGAAGDPDIVGQEALMGQRQRVIDDYTKMATEEPSANLVGRFLPSPDDADIAFKECFDDLDNLYDLFISQKGISDGVKFRLENAKRTLALMNGDESIEHHGISRVERYASFSYDNLPNTRQLLVLACRLSKVNTEEFVIATLAEKCCTPEKWQEWKRPFGSHFADVLNFSDFGQSLRADQERGNKFIKSIVAFLEKGEQLPAAGTGRIMLNLAKDLLKSRAERLVPLTEALFMVMRGHNTQLLDRSERNRPACAEGAYIGVLSSISEILPGSRGFSGVTLTDCARESLNL